MKSNDHQHSLPLLVLDWRIQGLALIDLFGSICVFGKLPYNRHSGQVKAAIPLFDVKCPISRLIVHMTCWNLSLSKLAIYHSLRTGMREAQLDEVISALRGEKRPGL
jgi:hypothetical protein